MEYAMAKTSAARKAPLKPAAARTAAKKAVAKPVAKPARPAAKPAPKQLAKPAPKATGKKTLARTAARKLAQAAPRAVAKAPAPARTPLVRDSFTMPEQEYAVLAEVKQACLKAGLDIKKSELLRIGVALVGQLDLAALKGVLAGLPQLKTGRPPGS
jgi:hypothetical protein